MQLSLRLVWHGSQDFHTVSLSAPADTSGQELARELLRHLGPGHEASVDGVPLELTRVGHPPLDDGATIVLRAAGPADGEGKLTGARADPPCCEAGSGPHPADSAHAAPPRGEGHPGTGHPGTPESPAGSERTACRNGPSTVASENVAHLVVVEGDAVGLRLPLQRGRFRLELLDGVPRLLPVPLTDTGATDGSRRTTLVMDGSGLRLLPRGTVLSHGDRVRVSDGEHESWARCMFPRDVVAQTCWPDPTLPPPGFSAQEADPSRPLRLEHPGRHAGRIALVTGLLPLVAGIGIAVATGWWFFLLFSALGAATSLAGWASERGARQEHRHRVAAALDRDLRRSAHAAPSSAEVVERCDALQGDPATRQGLHVPLQPSNGHAAPPSARHSRWVRLGHGPRAAQLTRERGTPLASVSHRRAPVLLDLAAVPSLTIQLNGQRLRGVLDSLVLQLFTGPQALRELVLSPGIAWHPPVDPDVVRPGPKPASTRTPEPGPPALTTLEVLTPQDAVASPPEPESVRVIVARGGCPDTTATLLTSHGAQYRLTTPVDTAVPGLCATEKRLTVEFLADTVTGETAARALGTWKRAVGRAGTAGDRSLPRLLGTHELLRDDAPGHVPDNRAQPRAPGTTSLRLSTAIGVSGTGAERIGLDDENPHLLIAGTTGCGKSEVLRTLILGLAAAAPPGRLEFVMVDFKGGAALAPLTALPHPTTLLTDLGPDEVRRALAFLRSELRRRERVLARCGFVDMAQALEHAGPDPVVRELVVVVDEAKMLTDSFPHAAEQLAVIAAVGRSLGVHLVLATQRPQGALPADVRANVTQALCLRVRTEQESMDVLGTSAAAGIPAIPGRGFLHRGDGGPVAVQCAVATRMSPPAPAPLTLHFAAPHLSAKTADRGSGRSDHTVQGIDSAVADVDAAWAGPMEPDPASLAVPLPLPRTARAVEHDGTGVDLGPAENPAEHWTGRATWEPWADGPLLLIGRPSVVREPFAVLARRCADAGTGAAAASSASVSSMPSAASAASEASADLAGTALTATTGGTRQAPVVYLVTATGTEVPGLVSAEGVPRHGAVRGWARADRPADLAHLLERLREALDRTRPATEGERPRAVLAVADWDRCSQILRSGAWSHLEDELLALVAAGPARGLSALVAGNRTLLAGRSAQLGSCRLHFPAGQAPDALLQWPRLPPMTHHTLRAAYFGPGAARCTTPGTAPLADGAAVVQLAVGTAPPSDPGSRPSPVPAFTSAEFDAWPRSFPLPDAWQPPSCAVPGLLLGVSRDGEVIAHPWGPGATLVVAGPARSGRTTFLDGAVERLSGRTRTAPGSAESATAWTAPGSRAGSASTVTGPGAAADEGTIAQTSGHRVLRASPRTAAEVEALLRNARATPGPVTIVIDDADALPIEALRTLAAVWEPQGSARENFGRADSERPDGEAQGPPGSRPGPRLVLSVHLTDSLTATFPPLLSWRHRADALLLRPRRAFDGDLFGASLVGQPLGGPVGRAFWVHRGLVELLQSPAPVQRPSEDNDV
ncbi:ESAT-6 secretion machinery protein EssC [Kocuria varians]|uniref:ESAT-6 secretion machinery protein EssC n=1 Tax=Kocuria varians TaxID=1272 RepID=A0A7D7L1C8_KOCVA|nr:ESAT-6 secretion machinery protein EssC [Kocuria varians]